MNKNPPLLAFLVLSLVAAPLCASDPGMTRVLFVGNSYAYADDIPWITARLASCRKEGKKLEVELIALAGATLQSHWERGDVVRRLHGGNWNYVVLQEQSGRPIESPELLRKYARLFDKEIKIAGARTVLFLTWPRQQHPEHLAALTNAYFATAQELGALIAPVGMAWSDVLNEKSSIRLYHEDGSHPGPIGSYLASSVLYSVFFDRSPVGLPGTLFTVRRQGIHARVGELSKEDAALLQRAAWRCVQNTRRSSAASSVIGERP